MFLFDVRQLHLINITYTHYWKRERVDGRQFCHIKRPPLSTDVGRTLRRSTCRGEIFKSRVWDKVPEGRTLIFQDTRIYLQHSVGQVEEASVLKRARSVHPFRQNTEL